MFLRRVIAIVLLTAVAGCSRNSATAGASTTGGTAARSSDVITAAELADPSVSNGDALEAVRRLRPRFLSSRGKGSVQLSGAGSVHISIDGGPLLEASWLSRMRPGEITEMRYLSANDAAIRFGTNAGAGGVILIKSK